MASGSSGGFELGEIRHAQLGQIRHPDGLLAKTTRSSAVVRIGAGIFLNNILGTVLPGNRLGGTPTAGIFFSSARRAANAYQPQQTGCTRLVFTNEMEKI